MDFPQERQVFPHFVDEVFMPDHVKSRQGKGEFLEFLLWYALLEIPKKELFLHCLFRFNFQDCG